MALNDLPSLVDREHRLKQLEFLLKVSEMRTARMTRLSNLIIVGNAGGIATCSVILKDLQDKFDERLIVFASCSFVIGLIAAGVFSFLGNTADYSLRKMLVKLSLTQEQNFDELVQMAEPDSVTSLAVVIVISAAGFFMGVALVLLSLLVR